jgi:hypothetical protein
MIMIVCRSVQKCVMYMFVYVYIAHDESQRVVHCWNHYT